VVTNNTAMLYGGRLLPPELRLRNVRDLVGMGPSAFHQSQESTRALSGLFDNEGESDGDGDGEGNGEDGRAISVTKSFVVQVFHKAAPSRDISEQLGEESGSLEEDPGVMHRSADAFS